MLLLLKDSHFSQMQNFYNAKIQKLAIKYWFEKKNFFFLEIFLQTSNYNNS